MRAIIKAMLITFVTVSLLCALSYLFRPYTFNVTPEGIKKGLDHSIGAQIGEEGYEVSPSDRFTESLSLNNWKLIHSTPGGSPGMTFRLAEEWIISLYDDGKAVAYYGYASSKEQKRAVYAIPLECLSAVRAYIEENGTAQNFSPGFFHH